MNHCKNKQINPSIILQRYKGLQVSFVNVGRIVNLLKNKLTNSVVQALHSCSGLLVFVVQVRQYIFSFCNQFPNSVVQLSQNIISFGYQIDNSVVQVRQYIISFGNQIQNSVVQVSQYNISFCNQFQNTVVQVRQNIILFGYQIQNSVVQVLPIFRRGSYSTLLVIFFVVNLFHCAIAPTHGLLYTKTKFPGEFNSSNDVPRLRSAIGCQYNYLGLVAIGNSGAGEIARMSEIRRIATIDHSFTAILFPIYGKFCTIVTGD